MAMERHKIRTFLSVDYISTLILPNTQLLHMQLREGGEELCGYYQKGPCFPPPLFDVNSYYFEEYDEYNVVV